ncbi:MAG: hypothetical protein M3R55_06980 [Acidobacteriota bacterium]|nr:hypothetical protein [Acidobacteriota bacterium]
MTKRNSLTRLAAAGVASAALIATVACNGNGIDTVRAERDPRLLQTAANGSLGAAAATGQQMLVNCGPYQRTLVRTTYLNGQPVASVDCVAAETAAPAGYMPQQQFAPIAGVQPVVYRTAPAPRVVRTVASARSTRTVYRDSGAATSVRRPVRTKTKSAVIIGGTAAAGAGVGALIGGKKGAVIGAIAGGGGAAVWDQVTRRKQQ